MSGKNLPDKKKTDYRIGHRQRAKAKYRELGDKAMSDRDLLELLLMYSLPRQDVKPIVTELLAPDRTLRDVLSLTLPELEEITGVGSNTALLLRLVHDLGVRALERGLVERDYMEHPEDFCNYARRRLSDYGHEVLMMFSLNVKNQLIHVDIITEGDIDKVDISDNALARVAISRKAKSVVICHNHPGGTVQPSPQDDLATADLCKVMSQVNIILLDHIIVSRYDYFSYRGADAEKPEHRRLLPPYPPKNIPPERMIV